MPGITRKRRAVEEDGVSEASEKSSDEDTQQNSEDNSAAALKDMVKSLIRLALAVEYQRRPLRRAEIGEKVLGTSGRAFKKVFEQAQQELRMVFGMELVELPLKEKTTVAQRRAAQQSNGGSKTITSWILTSVLPSEYHDPAIIPPSAIPNATEDSAYTAIYTTLVACISLNGGSLPEAKMDRSLKRLGMEDVTPVAGCERTEKLMKRLEKDGYIVKVREPVGNTGNESISWIVGGRGKVEVGFAGTRGLVDTVYGRPDDEEGAELARRLERSLGAGEDAPTAKKSRKQKKSQQGTAGTQYDDEEDVD